MLAQAVWECHLGCAKFHLLQPEGGGRNAPETATLPEKAPETAMAAGDLMPENMM